MMEETYSEWELVDYARECPGCRSDEIFSRVIHWASGDEVEQFECDACGYRWEEEL